jgi:hypothetical protein
MDDDDASAGSARPLLLLGRYGAAFRALLQTPALGDSFVVTTPEESSVEERSAALCPSAVLLESSEFILEGRAQSDRLRARSPRSRILYLDVDRRWGLCFEVDPEGSPDLAVAPCDLDRAGERLTELLHGLGACRRVAGGASFPLESVG